MRGGPDPAYILGWRRRQLSASGSGSGAEDTVRRAGCGRKESPHAGLIHAAGGSLREEKWEGCELGDWGVGVAGSPAFGPCQDP